MADIEIHVVEKFPEPQYSQLVEQTFFANRPAFRIEESRLVGISSCRGKGYELRVGAYDREQLVGWSFGQQDGFDNFYMQSSGVLPAYRRRGIYTRLLSKVLAEAETYGFSRICSLHVCTNNAVLIPKLKAGFIVTGLRLHAQFGVMAELSYCFDEKLEAGYRFRSGEAIDDTLREDLADWAT